MIDCLNWKEISFAFITNALVERLFYQIERKSGQKRKGREEREREREREKRIEALYYINKSGKQYKEKGDSNTIYL
jgi:hypothetical protein